MNETLLLAKESLVTVNPLLTSIVLAIVIFIAGLILGRISGKIIERIMKNFKVDPTLKKKTNIKLSIGKFLSVFVQTSIYIIFTIIALNYIGITSLLLNILFVAIIVILSISFLLALKDSLPNLIAGLSIRRNLVVGKKLKTNDLEGVIKSLTLFEVEVEKSNGDILHIPNSVFVKEKYVTKK